MNSLKETHNIILFTDDEDCCACAACMNVCPTDAISMKEDSYGYVYPNINHSVCIRCGLCKKVCAFQNDTKLFSDEEAAYAAVNIDSEQLKNSSSGGVFSSIATSFLSDHGTVVGCTLDNDQGELLIKHEHIKSIHGLKRLQGSKYVQSNIGYEFRNIKNILDKGNKLLFSGTPCQVDGLKEFLQKEYSNLFTIDIICHGVPNQRFFNDYIKCAVIDSEEEIINFSFRNKAFGWSLNGTATIKNKKGELENKNIPAKLSSYYTTFLKGITYRNSCYNCKYAQSQRSGDITIGDFWGIQQEHPEYMESCEKPFTPSNGISCVLINTEKGEKLIENYGKGLNLKRSHLSHIKPHNAQLNAPSKKPPAREEIMELYKEKGYEAVDNWFYKKLGFKKYIYGIWAKLPLGLKERIKNVLRS